MKAESKLTFSSIEDVVEGVFLDTCVRVDIKIVRETVKDNLGVAYQDFVMRASYNDKTKVIFPLIFNLEKVHDVICKWILNENSEVQ